MEGRDRFPTISSDGNTALSRDWDAGFCLLDLKTGSKWIIPGTTGVWSMQISQDQKTMALIRWREKIPYLCVLRDYINRLPP